MEELLGRVGGGDGDGVMGQGHVPQTEVSSRISVTKKMFKTSKILKYLRKLNFSRLKVNFSGDVGIYQGQLRHCFEG